VKKALKNAAPPTIFQIPQLFGRKLIILNLKSENNRTKALIVQMQNVVHK
jgi:hypothetical protein